MKNKSRTLLFLVMIVVVLALAVSPDLRLKTRSFFTHSTSGVSAFFEHVSHKVKHSFSFILNISSLKKQNDELSQKLVSLQVDSSQIEELKNENALLEKELGFIAPENKGSLVPARIVERDPTTFTGNIIIDKGNNDSIKKGMPVIASGTLVGTIGSVMAETSTVTLITSKDSIIQAMLQNSRAKGILRGGISGLYLDDITLDTEYIIGENIVTSGLGGNLPSGILIGKAGKLESASSSIFKTIDVEPIISISNLELVFIQK